MQAFAPADSQASLLLAVFDGRHAIEKKSSAGWCGPGVFAGRLAATPRGATWTFRGAARPPPRGGETVENPAGNKNANVKCKALKVIARVSQTGAPQFRRNLCRQLPAIKACLQFTGPPDPLRGDEPYKKVRDAAKEAIDAVTNDAAPPPPNAGGACARRADRRLGRIAATPRPLLE